MEIQSQIVDKPGFLSGITSNVAGFAKKMKKIGQDDPRRVVHSLKVSLALTLVSAFYYINPIFKDLGSSVMWAVLTVVLVMEFTVGAAVLKGLNRAAATFLAGALGLGSHHIAVLFGPKGEPVVLGVIVFLVVALATFARFVPELKTRYDYGVMIFILTFCLVTVSSYRKDNVFGLAKERFLTIAIGIAISFCTSMLVFPVWAGEDLNRLAAINVEKLASFFRSFEEVLQGKESGLQGHKGVLNTKSSEDSLSNLARFEPPHSRFRYRHPWDQYLKIGAQCRQCAVLMEALSVYTAWSQIQLPRDLQKVFVEMSSNCSMALAEVATTMRAMTAVSVAAKCYIGAASKNAEHLRTLLAENCMEMKEIVQAAPLASISMAMVRSVEDIVASVEELARLAQFRSSDDAVVNKGAVKVVDDDVEAADVSIAIEE